MTTHITELRLSSIAHHLFGRFDLNRCVLFNIIYNSKTNTRFCWWWRTVLVLYGTSTHNSATVAAIGQSSNGIFVYLYSFSNTSGTTWTMRAQIVAYHNKHAWKTIHTIPKSIKINPHTHTHGQCKHDFNR